MNDDNKTKKQLIDELTELRSQNAELKESESAEKYRSLVENLRDVIYELDSQGVVLYISPAIRDILGYDLAEIEGKNFIELAHKDDLGRLTEWFSELRKGIEQPSEYRVINKSGELRWALMKARPIMEEGLFKGARGILIDVTEQKRADRTLRESEEKYRRVFENSIMGISQTLRDGRLIAVNNAYAKMYGYANAEEMMTEVSSVGPLYANPEEREDVLRILTEKGVMEPREITVIHRNGTRFTVLVGAREIRDFKGNLLYFQAEQIEITKRKRVEDALRESEESLRSYLEYAPDGVYMSDMKGTFLYGNRKCEAIIGYKREELIGKNFLELNILPEKSLNKAAQLLQTNIDGKPTGPDEFELISKEGRIMPVEISTSVVQQMDQRIVLSFVRDITDRKRTEEALRESEEKYRWVLDNMADVITVMDMNLRFTYVSPSILRMRGYTAEEAVTQNLEQVMTPESLKISAKVFEEEMKLEASGTEDPSRIRIVEVEQYRKDGSIVLMENHLSFLRDEAKKAVGIISVSHDITERKRAEESLRENEERYKALFDRSLDLVYITDFEGRFLDANQAALNRLGYNREEISSLNFATLLNEDQVPIAFQTMQEIIATSYQKNVIELRLKAKNGNDLFVETIGSVILKDGIPYAVQGIARDITERKQAEDKIKKQTDAMESSIDGIAILNKDEEYLYLNKAHARIFGYENAGELIVKSWRTLYDADEIKRFDAEIMPKFGQTGYWQGEALGMKKDGSKFPQEISLTALDGGGLICIVRDITERKQAEEELRESEERFRRIFDEGPFGMGLENPDHKIIAVNKVLCDLLGYTEQELAGQNTTYVVHEEDREKSRESLERLFADGTTVFRMEKRYIRKDGTILWANTSISAIHGKEGKVLYGLAIIEDLTEVRKTAEKIHRLAFYDGLTGLPNRTFHKELIKRSIEHAHRHKEIFALIYIGLDNFQRINDTLGHSIGDLLLKAVADRLANSMRKSDHVARASEGETEDVISRVGGDEFIILVYDITQPHYAATTSRRLLERLSAPYDLNGREVFITVSIGIALYPDDGTDVDNLLKNAEKAMRHTKNEGKNNFHFYSKSMHTSVLELLTLENDLHRALERNELLLYYQPKVDAATRMVKGMEALIRWKHPDRGMIPPMQFIPMAETSGLIIPIGEFVIRTVCKQIKTWQDAGFKEMNIALNISSHQLEKQNLIEIFKDALQDTMISPQCLEMEITESTIMRNPEKAIQILTKLKTMGMGIAIDDFGTGYSSLSYLKRLPLDFLKIDQSFVKGVVSDPRDQTIVKATIAMAHSLKLKTIAEGVETEEQLCFLQEHGCDELQGYLFSRPLPAEEIPEILTKGYL